MLPGGIDKSWIEAGSNVLGKALQGGGAGPSSSDTGGYFNFTAPFVVTTGAGDSSLSESSTLPWLIAAAVAGLVAWKLLKKS